MYSVRIYIYMCVIIYIYSVCVSSSQPGVHRIMPVLQGFSLDFFLDHSSISVSVFSEMFTLHRYT